MTDRTARHLIAAGFIETSPRNFERGGILIQHSPALTPSLRVMAPQTATLALFSTSHVRQALLAAQLFENIEEAASSVISETLGVAVAHMLGEHSLERSMELEGAIMPADANQLRLQAERLLVRALEAAQQAGCLPTEEPGLDDETPDKPKAERWLTMVRATDSDAFIRTGAIHRTEAAAEKEAKDILGAGFYRSLPVAEAKAEPYALPYYATVSPSYYGEGDAGYTWEGLAVSHDDAVRRALERCHWDNGRPYIDGDGQRVEGNSDQAKERPHTTSPQDPSVTVHVCEPDFKALGVAAVAGLPGSSEALRAALEIAGEL